MRTQPNLARRRAQGTARRCARAIGFGAGRFATLHDPQGAVFSIYQMKDGEDVDDTRGPGKISWHELATTDWEAAWTFYEALLGWTRTGDSDMGEVGTYALLGTGGEASDGGLFDKPAEMPGPPMWLCYATVADLDATAEAVKARGGQVVNGPMEVPGGDRIAQIVDPQGAMFALHEAAPQAGYLRSSTTYQTDIVESWAEVADVRCQTSVDGQTSGRAGHVCGMMGGFRRAV